jgi:hypothetical protein
MSERTKAAVFIWSLVGVSVLFYVLTPLVRLAWWPFSSLTSVYTSLAYLTAVHVVLTQFVYFDRPSYQVIERHRLRFFVAVPLFMLAVILSIFSGQKVLLLIFFMYFGWWSYWHYQKQHYGVFCFLKAYCGLRPAPREKFVILAATVPAMLAIIPIVLAAHPLPQMKFIADHADGINAVATGVLLLVLLTGVVAAVQAFKASAGRPLTHRLLPAVFLVFLASNYWPFFVVDASVAGVMVTGGHGLQYIVFMAVYAFNRTTEKTAESPSQVAWRLFRGFVPVALMFVLGIAVWEICNTWLPAQRIFGYDNSATNGALGSLAIGITGMHYIQDGVLWRLSDRHSRNLAYEKYPFLFKPISSSGAGSAAG